MSYLKSAPSNLSNCKLLLKKNGNAKICDQKFLILEILGYNFKKLLSYLKSVTNPVRKFCEKTKLHKFGTKNALFGYFCTGVLKSYCHIWDEHPQICLTAKFFEKTKMPKFGTINALVEYFWAKILRTIVIFESVGARVGPVSRD